jgi:hypothetical protein
MESDRQMMRYLKPVRERERERERERVCVCVSVAGGREFVHFFLV